MKYLAALCACLTLSGCDYLTGCKAYASRYSCGYVENRAEYVVWYWRNVEADDEEDNMPIGVTVGLHRCRRTAELYAAAIGDTFTARSYICLLRKDGEIMGKHRLEDASL